MVCVVSGGIAPKKALPLLLTVQSVKDGSSTPVPLSVKVNVAPAAVVADMVRLDASVLSRMVASIALSLMLGFVMKS